MTYTATENGGIVRDADGAFIPKDPANTDYAAFLAWEASGNQITPYTAPPITWAIYQSGAQTALEKTDTTMHRIAEAVALGESTYTTADVVAFVEYRRALRAIINAKTGTPGTLPIAPAYPAGT
jgi:hypothetical protein